MNKFEILFSRFANQQYRTDTEVLARLEAEGVDHVDGISEADAEFLQTELRNRLDQ